MAQSDSIKDKISAYFNGRLSPEEEVELLKWIKEDPNNQAYFDRQKAGLNPDDMEHPLLESSFAELKNRLFIHGQVFTPNSGKIRALNLSFLKIAAMLVVALVFGFSSAYFLFSRPGMKTEVAWFETKVPRGEKSQLVLPDGSRVWLNSESTISYPSNFMDGHREIKLSGEAYFEVAKLKGTDFTVQTHDYNVRVLGTKFNVTAYSDFGRTETSLIEGKIEIKKGKQTLEVMPGQTVTFADNKFDVKTVNASGMARWKDNVFDFDRVTFKELVKRLERWYDVEIDIKNPELDGIVYSGIFKNEETIDEVLHTFQLTLPISYSRDDFRKFSINLEKR